MATTQEMVDRRGFGAEARRAAVLFSNFFLIILAYYHIKPASRSLLIEYYNADSFPYVWISTAVVLGTLIGFYNRIVERHQRLHVVLGSCGVIIALLCLFFWVLKHEYAPAAIAFYIFVDIFSVVLVEQFWSLANTIYRTEEGKRWYGIVATGGLVGSVAGGAVGTWLLHNSPLETVDLLLVAAGILVLVILINLLMGRLGIYTEVSGGAKQERTVAASAWRSILKNRYLLVIAALLLCAQICQPLVEFQFIKTIETEIGEINARTAFISKFFSVMGLISIGINLTVTPLIHVSLGTIAGLLVQPLALMAGSLGFMAQPSLMSASVMKISDRGLSYSINRASKELLYIPVDPVLTFQAKAWIDMFGYRLFKVLGSVMILAATRWLPVSLNVVQLSVLTLGICSVWILLLLQMVGLYRAVLDARSVS